MRQAADGPLTPGAHPLAPDLLVEAAIGQQRRLRQGRQVARQTVGENLAQAAQVRRGGPRQQPPAVALEPPIDNLPSGGQLAAAGGEVAVGEVGNSVDIPELGAASEGGGRVDSRGAR